jgi:hypothetical protein
MVVGGSGQGGALSALQHLQKLCNSACLLMAPRQAKAGQAVAEFQQLQADLRAHLPRGPAVGLCRLNQVDP